MISPSEGHYDMLLLQSVCPSLHMTTYIRETVEQPSTVKAQKNVSNKSQYKRMNVTYKKSKTRTNLNLKLMILLEYLK